MWELKKRIDVVLSFKKELIFDGEQRELHRSSTGRNHLENFSRGHDSVVTR